ncbi:unnamed protein product, partial [Ectocarpus sp. 12 AP-2014]
TRPSQLSWCCFGPVRSPSWLRRFLETASLCWRTRWPFQVRLPLPLLRPRLHSHGEWGLAVTSGDTTKLAELVLVWSDSEPERALSVLRSCVS